MSRRNWFKSLLGAMGLLALPKAPALIGPKYTSYSYKQDGHLYYVVEWESQSWGSQDSFTVRG